MPDRDTLEVDVLFVGGGPASLAGAIRLRQLAAAEGREISVMVIEKGGEIGNHGLSGAVVDPKSLHELFPGEDITGGLDAPVTSDEMWFLTGGGKIAAPFIPPVLNNHGKYVALAQSAHEVARRKSRSRSVPTCSRRSPAKNCCGTARRRARTARVIGVRVGDKGVGRDGSAQGELRARSRSLGEGRRARRGPARHARQDGGRAARARSRPRSASLRGRHQRALASSGRAARAGQRDPHARRAAAERYVRRRLDLRDERRRHRHRPRHRTRLRRPDDRPAQSLPADEDCCPRSGRCSRAAR